MSSSEGSDTTSSSKLSQFGLYRSIDARTEEFLRLSRKRQIRQGCACAAVSTAITVTVVVTVLLVYEYSVSAESSSEQNARKTSWHGLFNDTSFEAKYNNAKLNIDPATLKLLPIILKALNHNRFLEKLIQDSSSSPTYDRQDASEPPIKRSPFFYRVRTPLKSYAVDHKSPPVVHYKIPTRNLEYYTKIRKIKDYQRILKYLDRMINDKVPNGPIVIIKEDSKNDLVQRKYKASEKSSVKQTTIPTKSVTVAKLLKHVHKKSEPVQYLTKNPKQIVKHVCQCTKKLGVLLGKLVSNIQELLPELLNAGLSCKSSEALHTESQAHKTIGTTTNTLKVSNTSKTTTTYTPKTNQATTALSTNNTTTTTPTAPRTLTTSNIVTESPFLGILPKTSKNIENFSSYNNIYAMTINSTLRPKYVLRNHDFDNSKLKMNNSHITTTTTNVAAASKSNSIQENILTGDIHHDLKHGKETIANLIKKTTPYNYFLYSDYSQEITTEEYNKQILMAPAYEDDYKIIEITTLKNYDTFNDFGIDSLQLVKEKVLPKLSENKMSHKIIKETKGGQRIEDINLGIIRKMSDFIENTDSSTMLSKILTSTIQPQKESSRTRKKAEETQETTKQQNIERTRPEEKQETTTHNLERIRPENISRLHLHDSMLDNEDNRVTKEDIQIMESMRQIDSIKSYSVKKPKYDIQTSTVQTVENPMFLRSMIPYSRPLYLEIRRNDWKPEHHDYDTNIDLNLFDLL